MEKLFCLLFASMFIISCSKNLENELLPEAETTTSEKEIPLVIPIGSNTLRIDYPTNEGIKSLSVPFTTTAIANDARSVSGVTHATVQVGSVNDTYINIYDDGGNLLVENKFIKGEIATSTRGLGATLQLPEDAVKNYVTADGPYTNYHSSGVVMLDDSWPNKTSIIDGDYNDVVIDYDIELRTVDIDTHPNEAYREQIKVVMHLRTVGGWYPYSAGVVLEGLECNMIESYEKRLTLGNWNEQIPANTLSGSVDISHISPIIMLNNVNWLIQNGAKTTTYINSKTNKPQLINDPTYNPAYGKDPSGTSLYYNVNRGYVNVGGDLFTLTVVFKGKLRTSLTKEESDKQLTHFMNAVMNTETQNFFLRTTAGTGDYEIHLKGYNPTPLYQSRYATDAAKGVEKDATTTYGASDGSVWGFKVPVMTRHAWEREPFGNSYPLFINFQQSRGANEKEWYKKPDGTKISCWW